MSVNKYQDHLLVLPEDDANRQIANGFILDPHLNGRKIQILPPANGWVKTRDSFKDNHIADMRNFPKRMMLLLIDFDDNEDRLGEIRKQIPDDLKERVFVLGSRSEPENLKKAAPELNTFESIGKSLARDCVNGTDHVWGHDLLKHNEPELDRLIVSVKPFLLSLIIDPSYEANP